MVEVCLVERRRTRRCRDGDVPADTSRSLSMGSSIGLTSASLGHGMGDAVSSLLLGGLLAVIVIAWAK